jgi:magnesium chelatase subunit I
MSIANYENLVSNAERRAVLTGEQPAVARCVDLGALAPGSRGKLELTLAEEPGQEDRLIDRLVDEAVKTVFDQRADPKQFRNVVEFFEGAQTVELHDGLTPQQVWQRLAPIRGLRSQVEQLAQQWEPELSRGATTEGVTAAVAEFILHALHCHNRVNRAVKTTGTVYGG